VTTVRTVIHRRIDVPAPEDLPDGTEVILSIGTNGDVAADDDGPVSPAEIARVLAAMGRMQPPEIPDDVAADRDARERTLDRHGIDRAGEGVEGLGPVERGKPHDMKGGRP
jgi:hypothetical protein